MKTITCEIPLTGLPDDVARRVVGCEWRGPENGEWWAARNGVWISSQSGRAYDHPTLILRPEPWEGFKVLTGAAAIAMDECGNWFLYKSIPQHSCNVWRGAGWTSVDKVRDLVPSIPAPPKSCGDWRRDIWLNPDHPANRGEGK